MYGKKCRGLNFVKNTRIQDDSNHSVLFSLVRKSLLFLHHPNYDNHGSNHFWLRHVCNYGIAYRATHYVRYRRCPYGSCSYGTKKAIQSFLLSYGHFQTSKQSTRNN